MTEQPNIHRIEETRQRKVEERRQRQIGAGALDPAAQELRVLAGTTGTEETTMTCRSFQSGPPRRPKTFLTVDVW